MEKPKYGILSVTPMTQKEKDMYALYLQHSLNSPAIEFLRFILGDDYLKLIDILAGTTLKIPTHRIIERDISNIKVYNYVCARHFSEESIKSAAQIFDNNVMQTRKAVYRVANTLGSRDTMSESDLKCFKRTIERYFCEEGDPLLAELEADLASQTE